MSYEIKVTYGCPSHGITVNGQDYTDEMTVEDREMFILDALYEIRHRIRKGYVRITEILNLLEETNYSITDAPSETCGDHITEITYQIK